MPAPCFCPPPHLVDGALSRRMSNTLNPSHAAPTHKSSNSNRKNPFLSTPPPSPPHSHSQPQPQGSDSSSSLPSSLRPLPLSPLIVSPSPASVLQTQNPPPTSDPATSAHSPHQSPLSPLSASGTRRARSPIPHTNQPNQYALLFSSLTRV